MIDPKHLTSNKLWFISDAVAHWYLTHQALPWWKRWFLRPVLPLRTSALASVSERSLALTAPYVCGIGGCQQQFCLCPIHDVPSAELLMLLERVRSYPGPLAGD